MDFFPIVNCLSFWCSLQKIWMFFGPLWWRLKLWGSYCNHLSKMGLSMTSWRFAELRKRIVKSRNSNPFHHDLLIAKDFLKICMFKNFIILHSCEHCDDVKNIHFHTLLSFKWGHLRPFEAILGHSRLIEANRGQLRPFIQIEANWGHLRPIRENEAKSPDLSVASEATQPRGQSFLDKITYFLAQCAKKLTNGFDSYWPKMT